jgi:hypothetical protein
MPPVLITRFAPSPTGLLHLGHAHAALFAWRAARAGGGRFLVRIEDIDRQRCRPVFEQALLDEALPGFRGVGNRRPAAAIGLMRVRGMAIVSAHIG